MEDFAVSCDFSRAKFILFANHFSAFRTAILQITSESSDHSLGTHVQAFINTIRSEQAYLRNQHGIDGFLFPDQQKTL